MPQCVVDQSVAGHVQQLSNIGSGVGLLIGRNASTTDHVLLLAQAPLQESAESVIPQANTSATSLQLDDEWLMEYALEMDRLLPGGLCVIGLFLVGDGKRIEKSLFKLSAIAAAIRPKAANRSLLLHVETATGKLTMKTSDGSQTRISAFTPVDIKFAPVISSYQLLTCTLDVDISTPVPEGESSLSDWFARLVQKESTRIRNSVATVAGSLVSLTEPLPPFLAESNTGWLRGPRPLELALLLPFAGVDKPGPDSVRQAVGLIRLAGQLKGFAFVPEKDPAATAVEALQSDLAASLAARLEAMIEETHKAQSSRDLDSPLHPLLTEPSRLPAMAPRMPSRVLIPTKAGVPFCEYITETEDASMAVTRASELLGDHIAPDAVADTGEQGDRPPVLIAGWDPLSIKGMRQRASDQRSSLWKSMPFWAIFAVVSVVVARVIAWVAAQSNAVKISGSI